jgi:hypothetical protein
MIGLPMAYHALHSVAICCQIIVAHRLVSAFLGSFREAIPSCEGESPGLETLVLSVELRGPLNPQRIDGLDDNEQVAKVDSQSLTSTAESVVESLFSGEHVQINRYAR